MRIAQNVCAKWGMLLLLFIPLLSIGQDSDYKDYIVLEPIHILPKLTFENDYDYQYYQWFTRKVKRAYPFAEMAYHRMVAMDERLAKIKSKRKRKKYIKRVQKFVEQELTAKLKKLSRTEARILLKLVHRNTGITAFDLMKKYRSSWKAFWYNVTANLFKLSLKVEYDPVKVEEDHMIEDILQRASNDGELTLVKNQLELNWEDVPKRSFKYPPKLLKKALKRSRKKKK